MKKIYKIKKLIKHGRNKARGYWKIYFKRLILELKIVLPIILFFILLINFFVGRGKFGDEKEKYLLFKNDSSKIYLENSLLKTNQLLDIKNIFGGDISREALEPDNVRGEILKWQEISESYPGYRDAYLKLAILNWKIYRDFDSGKWLEKVEQVDPNGESLVKIASSLHSSQ